MNATMTKAIPESLADILDWMKELSLKHGDAKAMKILECIQGMTLAMKCFDEDIALEALGTIHEMIQAAKAAKSDAPPSPETFTVEQIADYIAGWAPRNFDGLSDAVLGNALAMLRDPQDGIAAVVGRKG